MALWRVRVASAAVMKQLSVLPLPKATTEGCSWTGYFVATPSLDGRELDAVGATDRDNTTSEMLVNPAEPITPRTILKPSVTSGHFLQFKLVNK